MGTMRNVYKVSAIQPERQRSLGTAGQTREDYKNIYLLN
jgi:hypothetical protein